MITNINTIFFINLFNRRYTILLRTFQLHIIRGIIMMRWFSTIIKLIDDLVTRYILRPIWLLFQKFHLVYGNDLYILYTLFYISIVICHAHLELLTRFNLYIAIKLRNIHIVLWTSFGIKSVWGLHITIFFICIHSMVMCCFLYIW